MIYATIYSFSWIHRPDWCNIKLKNTVYMYGTSVRRIDQNLSRMPEIVWSKWRTRV